MAHTVFTILLVLSAGSFGFSARPASLDDDKFVALSKTFEEWITNHGSSYSSELEKAQRMKIFSDNLDYINKHNARTNTTFKLGLNKFSDLTNEEFKAKYTMKTLTPPAASKPLPTDIDLSNAPSSLDWRQKGAVVAVKNQKSCGSCWAFSAAAAIESAHFLATGNLVSLSEQQLMDCDTQSHGCDGGYPEDAFKYVINNQGITTESDYPYMAVRGTCKATQGGVTISNFAKVKRGSEDALMEAVNRTPVSIIIDGSGQNFQSYSSGVFTEKCGTGMTHAVLAIGYGTSNGVPYWIVKNSWGTGWGEQGYMRIVRSGDGSGKCGMYRDNSYPIV